MIAIFNEQPYEKAKILITKPNNKKSINYRRLSFKRNKNLEFDFRDFKGIFQINLLP